jgi:NTE family protein
MKIYIKYAITLSMLVQLSGAAFCGDAADNAKILILNNSDTSSGTLGTREGRGPVLDEDKFITDYLWKKTIRLAPPQRPKIALVLGGGGARGLAHIGVLKVLEEEKIPIDMVVGTSVGALVGAVYCAGVPMNKIENMGTSVNWNELTSLSNSSIIRLFLSEHLISTSKIEKYLNDKIGKKNFSDLDIPFACVATDLITGEEIIFREGEVAKAARASATIPGVFDPVEYRHRYLVDGGLYNNVPTDVAKLMGADIVIAVSVAADFTKNNVSNIFMVLNQAIYIQGRQIEDERLKLADLIIKPEVGDVSAVDLGRSRECIDAGVSASRKMVPEIKRKLIERVSDQYLFK